MPNVTFNSPKPAEDAKTKPAVKKAKKSAPKAKPKPEPEVQHQETAIELSSNAPVMAVGGMGGDIGEVDFTPPKLAIVQSTGDLSSEFSPGSIVFNAETVVNPAPDPVTEWSDELHLSILYSRLYYKQNLDYDSDEMPDTVDTLQEVYDRGGTVKWTTDRETGARMEPSWIHVLASAVLVEASTDEAGDAFTIEAPDGRMCELGMWYVQKSAFSRAGKYIINQGKTSLRDRSTGRPLLHHGRFALQVRREKLGNYQVFVPRLRLIGRHDEEYIDWVSTLL